MVEMQLIASSSAAAWLSDALVEMEALSVSVLDADADSSTENALFGEPGMPPPDEAWQRSKVLALFHDRAALDHALSVLQLQAEWGQISIEEPREVPDQDWVRLTQTQFDPVEITSDFWIVPSWHSVPVGARRAIRLDPGLAFGTGTHPTTRMCLTWMARNADQLSGAGVMDYGCGSGILAIAACLHGASDVFAVDIDPAAVRSTIENAQVNQVSVAVADVSEAESAHRLRYDLVFANILATPLCLLAPVLCGLVKPGGRLILSGILDRQAGDLGSAYAPWVHLDVADQMDGWILMVGSKTGAHHVTATS
jgi:ribosomal protein L11 methyltransferase